jgi:hypothetical protein
MTNLGTLLGIPKEVFRHEEDKRLVLPSCRVGVEFEFEGVREGGDLPKEEWAAYWKGDQDRSLHDHGWEYMFSRPLFGRDVVEAVTELCKHARKKKYKTSGRTGLHVHIDVRDLTRVELARLVVLYALFEKAVYRLAGNNREDNVFCLPWYKAYQASKHAYNIVSEENDIRLAAEALAQEKYGGLNLDSLARYGSVEFRHALSTTVADWVIQWINVCLAFRRAAQKLDASPVELVHNLSAVGVDEFARTVFEDQFRVIWYDRLEHDVWSVGVETALDVLPQKQEDIDNAKLSWFAKVTAEIKKKKTNPSFKAYMEAVGGKKDESPSSENQNLYAGDVLFDEWANAPVFPNDVQEIEE